MLALVYDKNHGVEGITLFASKDSRIELSLLRRGVTGLKADVEEGLIVLRVWQISIALVRRMRPDGPSLQQIAGFINRTPQRKLTENRLIIGEDVDNSVDKNHPYPRYRITSLVDLKA